MLLDTYTADSLKDKEIYRPTMTVEGLLPVGLTTLAGSPKLGKSWLALNLCCCVAKQEPFLGRQTYEGSVLYLDLEGSPFRTQERLTQLGMGFPEFLKIAHEAPRLDEGLLDALEEWVCYCSAIPRLIVIDTVTKIRGRAKRGVNAYDLDSGMFAPLQKFALDNELSIVVITHLKKEFFGTSDDWLERITGSMGLSGVSDNVWGLFRKRGENKAYLRTSARDVNAGDFVISFDNGKWLFLSDDIDTDQFMSNPLVKYISMLDKGVYSAKELCDKYIKFCLDNNFESNLSEGQPEASFGIQIKKIKKELWRIKKTLSTTKKKDGTYYIVGNF